MYFATSTVQNIGSSAVPWVRIFLDKRIVGGVFIGRILRPLRLQIYFLCPTRVGPSARPVGRPDPRNPHPNRIVAGAHSPYVGPPAGLLCLPAALSGSL